MSEYLMVGRIKGAITQIEEGKFPTIEPTIEVSDTTLETLSLNFEPLKGQDLEFVIHDHERGG